MTQFNGDNTKITLYNGYEMTAEEYVGTVFEEWSYKHRGGDIAALLIFIVFLRCVGHHSIYISVTHHLF